MFKITNGLAPKYLCDSFQYVSDFHSINTRSSCNNRLYIPKPTLASFKRSLKYSRAILWNNLSESFASKVMLIVLNVLRKSYPDSGYCCMF